MARRRASRPASKRSKASQPPLRWFKGNTHTHTTRSDGDSPPGRVARWYRDHNYDFLVLSDHARRVPIDTVQAAITRENKARKRKPFLLIPGEEANAMVGSGGMLRMAHVLSIGASRQIGTVSGKTMPEALERCIDAIRAAGGLPHVNHPNFQWLLTADEIAASGARHFEIFNGHPFVHNLGGGGRPGTEQIWDDLLSRRRIVYGLAVDDAHHFKAWEPHLANPGRGWVMVRARRLSAPVIVDAIRRGDFYASTGVPLDDIERRDRTLKLRIKQWFDAAYRTEFLGEGGRVLAVDESLSPAYRLKRRDLYVRARVTSSGGQCSWTQPLFAPGVVEE